jgi:hypothetical protein
MQSRWFDRLVLDHDGKDAIEQGRRGLQPHRSGRRRAIIQLDGLRRIAPVERGIECIE